ncbi:MAG: ABC transporter permease [Acidimicrobiia bacterium]
MAQDPVTAPTRAPTTVVAPGRSAVKHVATVWAYRELLVNLVRKELKVRYKNSVLGFVWSLLNPALYLAVFTIVFQVVLGNGIPYFAIYLLSGLLAWNLFSASLAGATGSITGGASLVNKVYFPREILPLASVGANCVHFVLQAVVLLVAVALSPIEFDLAWLWLVVPTLVVLIVLTSALAILLAAVNVYARDTQHLLELLLLAWFWMTPIVYQWGLPAGKLASNDLPTWLLLLNPVVPVTLALQRALYGVVSFVDGAGNRQLLLPEDGQLWYLRNLGIAGVASVVLLVVAMRVFDRLEGNFAEEL